MVADPIRFTQFIGNAAKQIQVDKTLTNAELRSTAASLRMTPNDITLISAPLGKERKAEARRSTPSTGPRSPSSAGRCGPTPWRST